LSKKQWRILIAFLATVVVILGTSLVLANTKPAPTAAALEIAADAKAIFDLDTQLASVGRLMKNNSANTRVTTFGVELEDFTTHQRQTIRDWMLKQHVNIDEVSAPEGIDLTLPHGYIQRMTSKKAEEFDALLNEYLADLQAHLASIDTKAHFKKNPAAKDFDEVTGEVQGVLGLINR
jgi:Na+-transporting NADH:ubiquinone oxidoreductase subunit NqrC